MILRMSCKKKLRIIRKKENLPHKSQQKQSYFDRRAAGYRLRNLHFWFIATKLSGLKSLFI